MHPQKRTVGIFLGPWIVGYVILTVLPFLGTGLLSLTGDNQSLGFGNLQFVGLNNYRDALGIRREEQSSSNIPAWKRFLRGKPNDPRFYHSIYNSLYFTLFAVPLGLIVSLAIALLLHRRLRGMSIVRAVIYLPNLLGGVATLIIWSWLLNPQFGWINQALKTSYAILDPVVRIFSSTGTRDWPVPGWLYSPDAAKPAVILISLWTVGGTSLIFLAALRRVPIQLYEAATIDGANWWRRFRTVTLPMISPAILFNMILSTVFSMQAFSQSYLLQNRAQHDELLFFVHYLYRVAFEPPYRMNYASALAWILFAVLFVMILPMLIAARRWVYDKM